MFWNVAEEVGSIIRQVVEAKKKVYSLIREWCGSRMCDSECFGIRMRGSECCKTRMCDSENLKSSRSINDSEVQSTSGLAIPAPAFPSSCTKYCRSRPRHRWQPQKAALGGRKSPRRNEAVSWACRLQSRRPWDSHVNAEKVSISSHQIRMCMNVILEAGHSTRQDERTYCGQFDRVCAIQQQHRIVL